MTISDNQEAFSIGTMNPTTSAACPNLVSLLLCNSSSFDTYLSELMGWLCQAQCGVGQYEVGFC
jgi:hypothetical protein